MEQAPNPISTSAPQHVVGNIMTKLQGLPLRYVPEVEHFIDFLKQRHQASEDKLTDGFFQLSAEAWDDE